MTFLGGLSKDEMNFQIFTFGTLPTPKFCLNDPQIIFSNQAMLHIILKASRRGFEKCDEFSNLTFGPLPYPQFRSKCSPNHFFSNHAMFHIILKAFKIGFEKWDKFPNFHIWDAPVPIPNLGLNDTQIIFSQIRPCYIPYLRPLKGVLRNEMNF